MCFAAPLQAEPGDDSATATSKSETASGPTALNKYAKPRQSKKHAQRKSGKTALKSSTAGKATDVADDTDAAKVDGNVSATIPPSVANANAKLDAAIPAGSARAMSAKANTILLTAADKPADSQPAAEAGRAPRSAQRPRPRAAGSQARGADSADHGAGVGRGACRPRRAGHGRQQGRFAWDQTSLIGKISPSARC